MKINATADARIGFKGVSGWGMDPKLVEKLRESRKKHPSESEHERHRSRNSLGMKPYANKRKFR